MLSEDIQAGRGASEARVDHGIVQGSLTDDGRSLIRMSKRDEIGIFFLFICVYFVLYVCTILRIESMALPLNLCFQPIFN